VTEDDIRRLLLGLDTVDVTADVIAGNICSNGATSIDDESEQLANHLQYVYANNLSSEKRSNYAKILQSFGVRFETIDAIG
jgi:hypothetical protein